MVSQDKNYQIMILEESDCFYQGIKAWLSNYPEITMYPEILGWDSLQREAPKLDGTIVITLMHWIHFHPGFKEFGSFLEKHGHSKVLCFVIPCPQFVIEQFIATGIRGFIDWSAKADDFVAAVKDVAAGRLYVSARLPDQKLKTENHNHAIHPPAGLGLTKREMEVLYLICQGLSSKEIAAKLFLAKRTVDGYRANLLSKFGTNKSATMIRMVHEQQNSI